MAKAVKKVKKAEPVQTLSLVAQEKSFKNLKSLLLSAMFIAEGTAEQVESCDKEIANAVLTLSATSNAEKHAKILAELEAEKLIENGQLTSAGRACVINRNNFQLSEKFSLNFNEFVKNTSLKYQIAALSIIVGGGKGSKGIVERVSALSQLETWESNPEFNNSIFQIWKELTNLCDNLGMANEVDAYIESAKPK